MKKIKRTLDLCQYCKEHQNATKEHRKGNKKSQRFESSSHSTSSSKFTSSFSINTDYTSCAPTRSKGFKHPTFGS